MRNFTELYRMDLPHRAICVYIYLSDRANKDGICWQNERWNQRLSNESHWQGGFFADILF